jgi:Zn-finger protein
MELKMKHYQFFQNRECEYFPCHTGVLEKDFNCLFCYCPLYMLGPDCGGNFTYNEKGRKDCTNCSLPHRGDTGTELVKKHYGEIAAKAARVEGAREGDR